MLYVSFVEIFATKALDGFVDAGMSEKEAYRYSTLTFFMGVLFTYLLDQLVHLISHIALRRARAREGCRGTGAGPGGSGDSCPVVGVPAGPRALRGHRRPEEREEAGFADALQQPQLNRLPAADVPGAAARVTVTGGAGPGGASRGPGDAEAGLGGGSPREESRRPLTAAPLPAHGHHHDLAKMGVLTAVALGLHNLPEGLATFVAALADPATGGAIAVAIALHNIPEGLCVAMPVYYATGSRWKGLLWATVSGAAEPVAGLLGWLILANSVSPVVFAVLFASVAGMMVYISLRELLPTALRSDPHDRVVTSSCFAGMVVMALSLVVFSEAA